MMEKAKTYFFSDPHFFHEGIAMRFGRVGKFPSVEAMNEYIVSRWNEVVTPNDKVWVLGDCVFSGKENLKIFDRLNGRKDLVLGNHDGGDKTKYQPYFNKIEGAVDLGNGVLLTHIPVHPQCMGERFKLNVHGHTHEGVIMDMKHTDQMDSRYVCVSAEQVDYRPVTLPWIFDRQRFKKHNPYLPKGFRNEMGN